MPIGVLSINNAVSSGSALFAMTNAIFRDLSTYLLGKSTCDPLKHIMDNPILYGKIYKNTKESSKKSIQNKRLSTNKTTTFARFVSLIRFPILTKEKRVTPPGGHVFSTNHNNLKKLW